MVAASAGTSSPVAEPAVGLTPFYLGTQVTLGILDVAGRSEVAYVKHCPLAPGVDAAPCSPRPRATGAESVERSSSCSSSVNTAPDLWLVHLPGHYEIIYGSKAFDVHAGKLTTVV